MLICPADDCRATNEEGDEACDACGRQLRPNESRSVSRRTYLHDLEAPDEGDGGFPVYRWWRTKSSIALSALLTLAVITGGVFLVSRGNIAPEPAQSRERVLPEPLPADPQADAEMLAAKLSGLLAQGQGSSVEQVFAAYQDSSGCEAAGWSAYIADSKSSRRGEKESRTGLIAQLEKDDWPGIASTKVKVVTPQEVLTEEGIQPARWVGVVAAVSCPS